MRDTHHPAVLARVAPLLSSATPALEAVRMVIRAELAVTFGD